MTDLPQAALEDPVVDPVDSEHGQGLTEYALIIALVALIVIFALTLLGGKAAAFFNTAANSIPV